MSPKIITDFNLVQLIKKAKNILIVGHVRPDGDCLGSGFAIKTLCQKYGKDADFLCDSDKPMHYSFMPLFSTLNEKKYSEYDLLICVDCAEINRLGRYSGYVNNNIISVNIDHHETNNGFCKENYVVAQSSSACELVFNILDAAGEINDEIAFYLFCGLSTDTGHFMHSNTNFDTLSVAAKLLKYNINANQIANFLYRNNTIAKTKLIASAINSMRFFHDDEICIISVSLNDLQNCGCVLADTEGLTDYGMNIGKVKVTVCITEQNRPQYKVSYRSKSVDVAAAAGVFGGGGHKMAAGCIVSGHYEDVVRKIVKSITDGMD